MQNGYCEIVPWARAAIGLTGPNPVVTSNTRKNARIIFADLSDRRLSKRKYVSVELYGLLAATRLCKFGSIATNHHNSILHSGRFCIVNRESPRTVGLRTIKLPRPCSSRVKVCSL